jgi:acetoin utilization deacetylase AcuC-like enzyme
MDEPAMQVFIGGEHHYHNPMRSTIRETIETWGADRKDKTETEQTNQLSLFEILEMPSRITNLEEGLFRRGIDYVVVATQKIPVDDETTGDDVASVYSPGALRRALELVHPGTSLDCTDTKDVMDNRHEENYFAEMNTPGEGGTPIAVANALVTVCVAAQWACTNASPSFAAVRPPGHHASDGRVCGFCWRNNSLVAATYVLESTRDIEHVLIIDIDLHYGGGIERRLADENFRRRLGRKRVTYVSMHRANQYDAPELKTKEAKRYGIHRLVSSDVNTNARGIVDKINRNFEYIGNLCRKDPPGFIIVAAGFDHCQGETAGSDVTTETPLWTEGDIVTISRKIRALASVHGIAHTSVLEGGYAKDTMLKMVPSYISPPSWVPHVPPAPSEVRRKRRNKGQADTKKGQADEKKMNKRHKREAEHEDEEDGWLNDTYNQHDIRKFPGESVSTGWKLADALLARYCAEWEIDIPELSAKGLEERWTDQSVLLPPTYRNMDAVLKKVLLERPKSLVTVIPHMPQTPWFKTLARKYQQTIQPKQAKNKAESEKLLHPLRVEWILLPTKPRDVLEEEGAEQELTLVGEGGQPVDARFVDYLPFWAVRLHFDPPPGLTAPPPPEPMATSSSSSSSPPASQPA